MLSPRQDTILGMVVEAYTATGLPVGSRALAETPGLGFGASTIRNELAILEEHGLLAHPHTSAGRVPTDAGHRYFVDRLLPSAPRGDTSLALELTRREVDEAMRLTTETLSQVTTLMAVVSAPPVETSTIRHIEVLPLQPQLLMVVVITSTGGVTKRVIPFDEVVDAGLAAWGAEYLNDRLRGMGLGARMLHGRLSDPSLGVRETQLVQALAPAFVALSATAQDALYVDGTARMLAENPVADVTQLNALMEMLERRVSLLSVLSVALSSPDVFISIGSENDVLALQSLSVVAAGYGLPSRPLGTVSVIGPVRMDYAAAIGSVRSAAAQLSAFVGDVYDSGSAA